MAGDVCGGLEKSLLSIDTQFSQLPTQINPPHPHYPPTSPLLYIYIKGCLEIRKAPSIPLSLFLSKGNVSGSRQPFHFPFNRPANHNNQHSPNEAGTEGTFQSGRDVFTRLLKTATTKTPRSAIHLSIHPSLPRGARAWSSLGLLKRTLPKLAKHSEPETDWLPCI